MYISIEEWIKLGCPEVNKEKSTVLHKGAMQRLAPFNPDTSLDPRHEEEMAAWQSGKTPDNDDYFSDDEYVPHGANRESVPYMGGPERLRALHRLSAQTSSRRNPMTGGREFLLHRGVGAEEYTAIHQPGGIVNHSNNSSSWTPHYAEAKSFSRLYNKIGKAPPPVSAWVAESAINSIPRQYGKVSLEPGDEDEPKTRGPNEYEHEHEVIINPGHNSKLAQPHEVLAITQPKTTLHGRINQPSHSLRNRFGKFEEDLYAFLEPLKKAQDPGNFKGIVRATDVEGPKMVNHEGQLKAYPAQHGHHVEEYHNQVQQHPHVFKPLKGAAGEGITRKLVYKSPTGSKYMVKPYHERVIQRTKKWQQFPIQGWAEMANQALYHAGDIGHLHQKVHVVEHNMGPGHEREPALVVKMDEGYLPVADLHSGLHPSDVAKNPNIKSEARKIALMDFLTNNLDRHGGNLLVNPDTGKLLAVDHSRSFQYINNHEHKWNPKTQQPRLMNDRIRPYHADSAIDHLDPFFNATGAPKPRINVPLYDRQMDRLKTYMPEIEWWGQHSPKIRATMAEQLQHIKNPEVREHVRRNFEARADQLDQMAEFGLDNFGVDWHNVDTSQFRPGELTDQELEEAKYRKEQG